MSTPIIVSSAAELDAALAAARGGETIELTAGDYGSLSISNRNFSSQVTITGSADVTFDGVRVTSTSNLALTGMTYVAEATDAEPTKAGLRIDQSSNITVTGGSFTGMADDNWTNDGFGIRAEGNTNLTVQDSNFEYLHRGAIFKLSDGVTVTGNTVTNLRSDGFDFVGVENTLIADNFMSDFPVQVGDWSNGGDHKDFIQFWTAGISGASHNVEIRDNVLIQDGTNTQGIFIRSENGVMYTNFTIDGNIVYNSSYHGITVGSVEGSVVTNNTVVSTVGGNSRLTISTGGSSVVENNIAPDLHVGDGTQVAAKNNILVQNQWPDQPNYVGDVFANPFNPQVADDLALINGWDIGAMRPVTTPYRITSSADFDNSLQKTFSAAAFASDLPQDATYHWSFGDGTQATGESVVHRFGKGGNYDMTLTVTAADGTSTQVLRTEAAFSPLRLDLAFEGTGDVSDYGHAISWSGGEAYTDGVDGKAAKFEGDTASRSVNLSNPNTLTGMSEMTFSMDLQLNSRAEAGRIFHLAGAYMAQINGDSLDFTVWTKDGNNYTASADASKLDGGAWHDLSFSYDSVAGKAAIYMDGAEVGSRTGITGGPVADISGRDLFVGGSFGRYIDANLDNFRLYDLALSPTEEAALVDELNSGPWSSSPTTAPAPEPTDDTTTDPTTEEPTTEEPTTEDPATEEPTTEDPTTEEPTTTDPSPDTGEAEVVLDFDASGLDESSNLTLTPVGSVQFGVGPNGTAAAFDGNSFVELGKDERFYGSDTISGSLKVKADLNDGTQQAVLWNHKAYGVTVEGTTFALHLFDASGDRVELKAADAVEYGSWQTVGFDYSRETGTANLMVGGAVVATETGLDLDLPEASYWDVRVGSNGWTRGFTGEVAELQFARSLAVTQAASEPVPEPAPAPEPAPEPEPTPEPTPDPEPAPEPDAGTYDVMLDFDASGLDEGSNLTLTPVGDVRFGVGPDGTAAAFDGSSFVELGKDERFYGSDTISGALKFKADLNDGTQQAVLWNHKAYGVTVEGTTLALHLFDASGERVEIKAADSVDYGNWQTVNFDYSRETGTANLMVGGAVVATETGLDLDLPEASHWDVRVGSNGWTRGFTGEVADLRFSPSLVSSDGAVSEPVAEADPLPEPDVLLNFTAEGYDPVSDLTLSPTGSVEFGLGDEQEAASFDGDSTVRLGKDPRFYSSDTISMSFDFMAEDNTGTTQTMVWNHKAYGVTIEGTDMTVSLFDASGTHTKVKIADAVNYNTWQNATFEYSAETQTANVWVDGQKRATQTGLALDIPDASHWDVVVGGNGWGKDFTGDIRNLEFTAAASTDGSAPVVGSYSTTLQSLALMDYSGVTTSTTSSLSSDDTTTTDSELFTVTS